MSEEFMPPLAFGVSARTGRPLECNGGPLDAAACIAHEMQQRNSLGNGAVRLPGFAVMFGYDPDKLDEVGWGLVFSAEIDHQPYIEALSELIKVRQCEAGSRYRVFAGSDGVRPQETARQWLRRHRASLNIIDPADGVPYYLLLVGPPSAIPFEFQYSLDIVAAVGRLDFPILADYSMYAKSVSVFESRSDLSTKRKLELFATCHDFDLATQLFTAKVAEPFSDGRTGVEPFVKKYNFQITPHLKELATKEGLRKILTPTDRPSSILLTGTHGMVFGATDPLQAENQGALVCQDWSGYGRITSDHWFAAADVPADANVHGLIHFFFACYGAGTPEYDNFSPTSGAVRIALEPKTSRLPQKLMTLPEGGILASLGHVDKAWASSFQSGRGRAQTQGFRDVLNRLMVGQRVGLATDQFNAQWGVLSTELLDMWREKQAGMDLDDNELLALQCARDDFRNYIVLGDPAVRLRTQPPI